MIKEMIRKMLGINEVGLSQENIKILKLVVDRLVIDATTQYYNAKLSNHVQKEIEEYVRSEEFLDTLIDRINNKQLKWEYQKND